MDEEGKVILTAKEYADLICEARSNMYFVQKMEEYLVQLNILRSDITNLQHELWDHKNNHKGA